MGSILCNHGRGTSQEGDQLGCWDIHKVTHKNPPTVLIFCCTPLIGRKAVKITVGSLQDEGGE